MAVLKAFWNCNGCVDTNTALFWKETSTWRQNDRLKFIVHCRDSVMTICELGSKVGYTYIYIYIHRGSIYILYAYRPKNIAGKYLLSSVQLSSATSGMNTITPPCPHESLFSQALAITSLTISGFLSHEKLFSVDEMCYFFYLLNIHVDSGL